METQPQPPPKGAETPREKKPWPLSWIALAIAVYIVGYTAINVLYRKEAPPHEPAAEMEERRRLRTVEASTHGWTLLPAEIAAVDPADVAVPSGGVSYAPLASATISRTALPDRLDLHVGVDLALITHGSPALHDGPATITAASRVDAHGPLVIQLGFANAEKLASLGEPWAYIKDNRLHVFLNDAGHLAPGMAPTPPAAAMRLSITPPIAGLPAGTWQATLYAANGMFDWTFEVPPMAAP